MSSEVKLFTGSGPTMNGLTNGLQSFMSDQLSKFPSILVVSATPTLIFDGKDYHLTVAVVLDIPPETPSDVVEEVRAMGYIAHLTPKVLPPPG